MEILSSKWMLIALGLVVLLVILYFTGNKSVHHEIVIQASPEEVWAVLSDTDAYPAWNPVLIPQEGTFTEGANIVYEFKQDASTSSTIPATVKQIIPNELLNQNGGLPVVLTYNHKYILQPEGAQTRVIIHEDYRGIGVNFWNPAPVEEAYGRLNEALKQRVESL